MTPKNTRDRQLRDEVATLRVENAELQAIVTKTKEALQESEERYRVISQVVSDWVYGIRFEATGEVVREWATEAFVQISGFTDEELDASGGWASIVHPDDQPIMKKRVQALRSGNPDVSEYRIVTKSGDIRWLRDYGRPVSSGAGGDSVRIYGAAQDITERKQEEEARDQLFHQLQDAYANVKVLSGLLPICASCKKIRDDKGYWNQIEHYIRKHSEADFTHGICPDCKRRLYPNTPDETKDPHD